jgi:GNAT superfamily N-acetyltransferase
VDHAGLTVPVEVRRARSDELGACADLYVRVLRETFTWLPAERHRREDFLRAARDEEIYVAVEGGRVIGLAAFFRPQNFLHSLYVEVRGGGVGKALLDHVRALADGPLSLKVQAPNLRAQAFYRREGFRCIEHGRDPGSDVDWLRLVRPA